jgi:excisionase family DNA binding protein
MTTQPTTRKEAAPSTARLAYTIAEAAAALRISRTKLYELTTAGDIESVHIGRSRKIPADALTTYLARLRIPTPRQGDSA